MDTKRKAQRDGHQKSSYGQQKVAQELLEALAETTHARLVSSTATGQAQRWEELGCLNHCSWKSSYRVSIQESFLPILRR